MDNFYRLAFLLLLFSFTSTTTLSQSRIFEGTMRDDAGEVLPGGTVVIKGTTKGTVTDIDGNYQLKVKVGDVLVLSFAGMTPTEVIVTKENSIAYVGEEIGYSFSRQVTEPMKKPKRPPLSDFLKDSVYLPTPTNEENVKVFTPDSPKYQIKTESKTNNYKEIREGVNSLKFIPPWQAKALYGEVGEKGLYILKPTVDKSEWVSYAGKGGRLEVIWNSSFSFERVNRLPKVQNTFAQGRPIGGELTWQGAETNEVFS